MAKTVADALPALGLASPKSSAGALTVRAPTRGLVRQAAIIAGRSWLLHGRLYIRAAGALLALVFIVGLYQAREPLARLGENALNMVQGEFAAAGFGIDAIKISGQTLTRDDHIVALLMMSGGSSTLDFNARKAHDLLRWMRAVDTASVRKVYPGQVIVDIVEKTPAIRWRVGTTTWLVDDKGQSIGTDSRATYTDLPLVVGEGAGDDAIPMARMLDRHPLLQTDLAALSRIGDRRWDLIYYTGLRVQLPEHGVAQALTNLESYQRDYALLDRDVTLIDLRVPEFMALKPGPDAVEKLAADAKAAKTKPVARIPATQQPAAQRAEEAN
jgi:cell division protein FtsQ